MEAQLQTDRRSSNVFAVGLVVTVSIIVAASLFKYAMAKWSTESAYQTHRALVAHTADAPNRYRVLAPAMVELASAGMPGGVAPQVRFLVGYFVYYEASIVFSLMLLFVYLRQWYANGPALVGILVAAVSMLVAFGDGYFQPWSLLEIGLFTAGLLAMYRGKRLLLAVIIAAATLNRETGALLVAAYLLIHLQPAWPCMSRTQLMWSGLYGAIWASIFFGLRLWLGPAEQVSLADTLRINLEPGLLLMAGVNCVLLLGAGWVLVWQGYRVGHPFVRATWRVVPVTLAAVLVFGAWSEVRLLTPLYPILISTGMRVWDEATRPGTAGVL